MNPILFDILKAIGIFLSALIVILLYKKLEYFIFTKMKGGTKRYGKQ